MRAVFSSTGRHIHLPPSLGKEQVLNIPGRVKMGGYWSVPATPFTALTVQNELGDLIDCDCLNGMADQARSFKQFTARDAVVVADTKVCLRPDQREAVQFLSARQGAMLSSIMGAGKTITALATCMSLNAKRILVFAPKSVVVDGVWEREAYIVGLDLPVHNLHDGSSKERADEVYRLASSECVIVLNYQIIWRKEMLDALRSTHWDFVIADESHHIKSAGSRVSNAAYLIGQQGRFRLALTGTPMSESPLDIYGQFRFLDVGVFGSSYGSFSTQYAEFGGYHGYEITKYINQKKLARRIAWLTYKAPDDAVSLPPETDIVRRFDISTKAKRLHNKMDREMLVEFKSGAVSATNVLTKMLRMQQITSGFVKLDDEDKTEVVDTCRADTLQAVLEDIDPREPLVVYYRFVRDRLNIKKVLAKAGRSFSEVRGWKNTIARWKDGKTNTLLVQISSGSEGVSMTRARYMIFYSLGYKLREYEQARKRISRPGQTRPCMFISLVANDTVDEDIRESLLTKRSVVETMDARVRRIAGQARQDT